MKRVLHTVPGVTWSGAEHRVLSQALWLRENGVTAWIATPSGGAMWQRAQAAGLPLLAAEFGEHMVPGTIMKLRRFIRTQEIAVVDCHGQRDAAAVPFCRDLAVIVRTVHTPPSPTTSLLRRLHWRFGYDAVIAVSQSVAERLRALGAYVEYRDRVIGDWAEPEFFAVAPARAGRGPLRLLMAGVLRPDKGFDLAIEAMRLLKARGVAAELRIAGSATAEHAPLAAQLRAQADAAGLSPVVEFLGDCEDVPRVMETCDVVLVPSREEVQSRVAAQALAAGRPVVGTNVGSLPELVRPGETGWLVPPGDAGALAECLAKLARDRAALAGIGAGARRFAGRSLRMREKMFATLAHYRSVHGTPRPAQAPAHGAFEPV